MTRKKLPPFRMAWNRLPEYLNQTNNVVQSLQVDKVAVGKLNVDAQSIAFGTPFIIGRKYFLQQVSPGDDFSNIGYVADNVPFIATGTTPTAWLDSGNSPLLITEELILFYNDIDTDLYVNYNAIELRAEIKVTNNSFNPLKTYPVIPTSSPNDAEVLDNNTIASINSSSMNGYFKIEVYN